MAIDVLPLWDFRDPAGSERVFRAAMEGAGEEDRLVLLTQVGRCQGLQGDFAGARQLLDEEVGPHTGVSPEVRARYLLERGRTLCSAAHKAEDVTDEERGQARSHYLECFELCRAERLDYLALDALHMMVCVDTAPEDQLAWNQRALDYMDASDQAQAKLWEGSLTNNVGYALHLAGRYREALDFFSRSKAAHERAGKAARVRVARWMTAWTYRVMGELDRALELQLDLEQEWASEGDKDVYVFQELEVIYRAKGDGAKADHYKALAEAG